MYAKRLSSLTCLAALLSVSGPAYGQVQKLPCTWTDNCLAVLGADTFISAGNTLHVRGLHTVSSIAMTIAGIGTVDFIMVLNLNTEWKLPYMTGPTAGKWSAYAYYDSVLGPVGYMGGGETVGARVLEPSGIWHVPYLVTGNVFMGPLGWAHIQGKEDIYAAEAIPTSFYGFGEATLTLISGKK